MAILFCCFWLVDAKFDTICELSRAQFCGQIEEIQRKVSILSKWSLRVLKFQNWSTAQKFYHNISSKRRRRALILQHLPKKPKFVLEIQEINGKHGAFAWHNGSWWLTARLIKAHHGTFSWRKHILWLFDQTLISALLFLATVLNRSVEKVPLFLHSSYLHSSPLANYRQVRFCWFSPS